MALCAKANVNPHLLEHVSHRRPHVVRDHDLDSVVSQESGNSGVMCSFRARIVLPPPTHFVLSPAEDRTVGHVGDRHAIRSTPTQVD